MTVEPMTPDLAVATLRGWADHMRAENSILQTRSGFIISADILDAVLSTLDAERTSADAAEAERDAALARAMPEPRLLRTVEEVEALPDGNYAYCFAQGKRLRGLATKRNRVWTFIGTDDECEPNSVEMIGTWVAHIPDLPTPTAAQETSDAG